MTTQREITTLITNKYHTGQAITMRHRNKETGNVIKQYKAEIIKFYPYHISCLLKGHLESFTYYDFLQFTQKHSKVVDDI